MQAEQRDRDPIRRVERQEAAVLRPHHFSYVRVGGDASVRSIRRREEEVILVRTDRDRRVLYNIRIDRSVVAEGIAVKGDSRKEHIDVVFNGDIATERGGCVLRGRRRSGERDVYITGSYSIAEHRIHRRRIREERGR